ncbi:MAG: alpha/beta hydrolase-fold protein [Flavobacteriales bacterium]
MSAQRTQEPEPFVLGVIESIRSEVLGEDRVLNIHLPHGYAADSAATYPVIYLVDGSADEDFIHISGAVQFASFPWIEWLEPSIVVGIANVDRKRDLTFPTNNGDDKAQFPTTGGSAAFMHFLADELIPFVEGHYCTGPGRTLIGQSLGGLFATEVLLKRPELFTRYMIVSPSLWWDDGSLLKVEPAFMTNKEKAPRSVFIAVGKEGKGMVGPAKDLAAIVRKQGVVRVGFRYFPEYGHADPLHGAVMEGFRWAGSTDQRSRPFKRAKPPR